MPAPRTQAAMHSAQPVPPVTGGLTGPGTPLAPASPARARAGAQLVVLSATLVACTRPWSRFEVARRQGGLVLNTIEPDGRVLRHVIPIAGVQVPDLAQIAGYINDLGLDRLTGRRRMYAVQASASGNSATRELVQCAARVATAEGQHVLHLDLPLVVRQFDDGTLMVFRPVPQTAESDEPTWADF